MGKMKNVGANSGGYPLYFQGNGKGFIRRLVEDWYHRTANMDPRRSQGLREGFNSKVKEAQ
jgi:hypothetical protein